MIDLSIPVYFFGILQRKFSIGEKLEVNAKIKNYVTVFAIVGTHRPLKVLKMKLLIRRKKYKIAKTF